MTSTIENVPATAVQADELQLYYGAKAALDGVSFELAPERIYGLLGRNGSGKTSLLSIISAFRRQTAGTVRVAGEPVFENPAAAGKVAFIGAGPGIIPEDYRVKAALREARLLRASWDEAYARQLLELFDLPEGKPISALSRGKKSALGVVIGLASRAPVTIFDETHLGMDAPSRKAFYDALLADFIKQPRTFILSTHLIDEVRSILETVLIINEGKLLLQDDVETLLGRGVALTGPAEAVDSFITRLETGHVGPLDVIGERQLGPTKSVMLYGALPEDDRRAVRAAGLDLEPLQLQELFIYLTEPKRGNQ